MGLWGKVKIGACFFPRVGKMLKNFGSHAYPSERDALPLCILATSQPLKRLFNRRYT